MRITDGWKFISYHPFELDRIEPWLNPVQLLWLTLLISNEGIFVLTLLKQHNNLIADKTENSSEVIESIIGNHNQWNYSL